MRMPLKPPPFLDLLRKQADLSRLDVVLERAREPFHPGEYPHWDKLRHLEPPEGLSLEEWWLGLKFQRAAMVKPLPLLDKRGKPFQFCVPDLIQAELHQIDVGAGRAIGFPDPITNPQTRDRYLIRSLIEEAISSSQLEGAVTTREVAKEMIRAGRAPRDPSERMILNNFLTMQRIPGLKDEPISGERILEIHRWVTEETLDDPTTSGRFRRADEPRVVGDDFGQVFHEPPPAEELPARFQAMCSFANGHSPAFFVHPAVRQK